MDEREKNDIAKLLNHDPAYVDRAKVDYVRYTAKNLPIPRPASNRPDFLGGKLRPKGRAR